MGIVIDLTLVAIIALFAWRGWRAGIIRGVCGFVALIVSICISNVVATAYSGEFTGMLKPFASGIVDAVVTEALSGGEDKQTGADNAEVADTPLVTFPRFEWGSGNARELSVYVLERVGLSRSAAERVSQSVAEESESITAGLTARITDKLCGILAYIAVFIVSFLMLAIIFAVIGNLINLVFSIPGLELLDRIAGGVFGVAKILLLMFTLATALRYIGLLTSEIVDKTAILHYIVSVNPVANILGI